MLKSAEHYKKGTGFTLVETVLYLALFAAIFVVVVEFSLAVAEANNEAKSQNALSRALVFMEGHLENTVSSADSIDQGGTVFEQNNGVLQVINGGETRSYHLLSGVLIYSDSAGDVPISRSDVSVSRFYLEPIHDKDGQPVGVRMTVVVESERADISDTYIFSSLCNDL